MIRITPFLLSALLVFPLAAAAENPEGPQKGGLSKTLSNDQWDFISVNNILMWMSNNGRMSHNPLSDQSGCEWPKRSAKYVIFTDGIIWGGKIQGQRRVGGATYNAGLQAGPILPDGKAADPSDPRYRIFKIQRVNAEQFAALSAADQQRLQKDFVEWPAGPPPGGSGAPWRDRNGNGIYEPNFTDWLQYGDSTRSDIPLLPGDENIWFVSNDLDSRRTVNLYGSPPIGIELHTLVWAYKRTGPLSNIVFTRYTIINKGTDDLLEAYFSKWSDPDLGDAWDDFVGIDTTLSLGYAYNGLSKDEVYGVPPAAGYDFFQGPIVPSPGDSARYNFGIRTGVKNLGVSSFAFYINGSSVYRDPDLKDPAGAEQMYNYMQGRLYNGRQYVDPTTGQIVRMCLPGDPITRAGWIDGIVSTPGDRRFLMTSGPFTLARGDTQEVVVSTIVGRGSDRLNSIKVLKYFDRYAQIAFDNNFDLPQAPPSPIVRASLHNRQAVLTWGDPDIVARVEKHSDRGYRFQGYNVYQFRKASDPLDDAVRLATFDVVDGTSIIFDEVLDEKSGIVLDVPVQFGTDGGLERSFEVTKDFLLDRPLVNNQPYYFAVTAYAFNPNPDATPRQLESTPVIIEVRPQTTDPGVRFGEPLRNRIVPVHTGGTSTGFAEVEVVDPLRLTGDTYEVSFRSTGNVATTYDHTMDGGTVDTLHVPSFDTWVLKNVTKGTTPVTGATGFHGLQTDYYVVDGFKIGVRGSSYYTQYNAREYDPANPRLHHDEILLREWIGGPEVFTPYERGSKDSGRWWECGYNGEFGSSLKGYQVDRIVEIRFDSTKPQKGYMFLRGASPNYGYRGYFDSPIQVWDVTDADPSKHFQLCYAWVEQFGRPAQDNRWGPTTDPNDREMLYILNERYTGTPNPAWTDPSFRLNTGARNMPILYWSWHLLKTDYAGQRDPWQRGTIWRITPKVAFSERDTYTFSTIPPTFSKEQAKSDVSAVNVFPNPYYASNTREQNKYQRFVTINHLPARASFKIYTLSGVLVRSFEKNDASQYATWNLLNDNGLPIASGLYYIHIEMPDLGLEKTLRLAVVTETQFLDRI
ncbi:MAG: T9SS type A sorting domain-containing protein [Ignavibacteriae bacterium]|nr:T9SS type A sorting domain-containing protein [Ignavibacteriota bacterium]